DMRRVRRVIERYGMEAVLAQPRGRTRRRRIRAGTIELLIRLKRDVYAEFSVRHFYEQVTEKHQVKVSYNWLRLMLQEAGVVEEGARARQVSAPARAPADGRHAGAPGRLDPRMDRRPPDAGFGSRSTMPTGASCMVASFPRNGSLRPSRRWTRCHAAMAASWSCTPTAAATSAAPRR